MVCKSMGEKNSVVYVCGSAIDSKGRFREVSPLGVLSMLKLRQGQLKL